MEEHFTDGTLIALRDVALDLPEVSEGASCVNRAFKARKKNFVFLGEKPDGACRIMLKVGASSEAASKQAASNPDRYSVGGTGWVTVLFDAGAELDAEELADWLLESYRLLAPRGCVALLPD